MQSSQSSLKRPSRFSRLATTLSTSVTILVLAIAAATLPTQQAYSQDAEPKIADAPAAEDELALRQSELSDRYQQLEKLILRMAEFDSADNPRRADLLKQAFALSKDRHVAMQLDKLVELLNQKQLGRAVTNQKDVRVDLDALLELLMSENRADRLKDEQARIRGYIKELERLERMQRSVQGRTEGGLDPKQAAKEQQRVAERTDKLQKEIAKNEGDVESKDGESKDGESKDGESKDGESKDGESKDGEPKDGESKDGESKDGESKDGESKDGESKDGESKDGESKDGESKDGESKDGESKDGESKDGESKDGESKDGESKDGESKDGEPKDGEPSEGEPSEGEPSEGEPSEGKPSEGKPSKGKPSQGKPGEPSESESGDQQPQSEQEEFPGKNRIEEAQEKMKQAQLKLSKAQREEAVKDQEEAAQKLAEAKAELEEILRQMREEEIERVLAMLESRFRKMLEMELQIYEGTMRLAKLPAERRDQFVDIESGKLSFQQRRVVVEAEKCLALLREEGSSVAFPESVMQMRDDMKDVEQKLGKAQIGRLTQGLEEDIIEALDEMIAALQQAQKDQEERKQQQQQQQQQQSQEQDQALVNQIAELKMLKALQMRVNKKTNRYARLLDDTEDVAGQASDEELIDALGELADREERLQSITRDIVVGKNK